jgi:hypothetical protein
MKNKKIISKLLLFSLVASFLLQTGHSYEHFFLEPIKKICKHENSDKSKKQITHAHELVEQCKVCSFSVSSFIENSFQLFKVADFVGKAIYSSFKSDQNFSFYKGSLFALRAPPSTLY